MSGWNRKQDTFHLELGYGKREDESDTSDTPGRANGAVVDFEEEAKKLRAPPVSVERDCKYRVRLDWTAGEDEDQVALRLQSQVMATLPPPYDHVQVSILSAEEGSMKQPEDGNVQGSGNGPYRQEGTGAVEVIDLASESESSEGVRGGEGVAGVGAGRSRGEQVSSVKTAAETTKKNVITADSARQQAIHSTDVQQRQQQQQQEERMQDPSVQVNFRIQRQREPLRVLVLQRTVTGSTATSSGDGLFVLSRLLDSKVTGATIAAVAADVASATAVAGEGGATGGGAIQGGEGSLPGAVVGGAAAAAVAAAAAAAVVAGKMVGSPSLGGSGTVGSGGSGAGGHKSAAAAVASPALAVATQGGGSVKERGSQGEEDAKKQQSGGGDGSMGELESSLSYVQHWRSLTHLSLAACAITVSDGCCCFTQVQTVTCKHLMAISASKRGS